MSTATPLREPLGVRATSDEHRLLTEAAQREHRSLSSFVLRAALQAAEAQPKPKPKRTREEIEAIVKPPRKSSAPPIRPDATSSKN